MKTFIICTTFNSSYFDYGYSLLCSVTQKYPTQIFIKTFDLNSLQIAKIKAIPNIIINNVKTESEKPTNRTQCYYYYDAKAKVMKEAMYRFPKQQIMFIDSDSILLNSLNNLYKLFTNNNYHLGTHCRLNEKKASHRFCSNNIIINGNSPIAQYLVEKWNNKISRHNETRQNALVEQYSLYKSYKIIKKKNPIRLLCLNEIELPIYHAKEDKFEKCPNVPEKEQLKRREKYLNMMKSVRLGQLLNAKAVE